MNDQSLKQEPAPDVKTVLGLGDDTNSGRFRRWRGWIIGGIITVGVIVFFVMWGVGGSGSDVKYIVEKAARGDLTVIVTATGSVQPTNKVDVSSELSGIIRKVLVDYNTPVKIGQRLAELDTDKLEATAESARAKLAAAEARVMEVKATILEKKLEHERRIALVARKVSSERDLEAAKAAYDRSIASLASAHADVSAAKADLKLHETNLAKTCICSPINGVVLTRNVEPGQTVATSFQTPILFSIAEDLKKMEIQVDVDEADVGKVREGQQATFTVDAYPDRVFAAQIKELRFGSEVVQGVVTYKAVLTTDNSELLLRPGMTATAEVTVQKIKAALAVPNAALRFSPQASNRPKKSGGLLKKLIPGRPQFRPPSKIRASGPKRTLWVLRDGAPVAVPVIIGPTDGKRTQILKGQIKPGQAVIIDTAKTAS